MIGFEYRPNCPKVAVGLPTYNGAKHLRAALDTLLEQDYPNIEIFISDNASTDETPSILKEYLSENSHLKMSRNGSTIGAFENFNLVFEKTDSKYFMWASDHDSWSPSLISSAVKIMESQNSVGLVSARNYWRTIEGKVVPILENGIDTRSLSTSVERAICTLWSIYSCAQFYGVHRRSVLKNVMPIRKRFGMDVPILVEIAARSDLATMPDESFVMRQLASQNDITAQLNKCNIPLDQNSASSIWNRFKGEHIKLAFRNFHNPIALANFLWACNTCLNQKFSWIPEALRQAYQDKLKREQLQ